MTPKEFNEAVTTAIAAAALDWVIDEIPSAELRDTAVVQVYDAQHAAVHLTHYWALYVHDGRYPFRKANIMCWFRDPKMDPRLNAGVTPARLSQVRHLTGGEFRFWLNQNRAAEIAHYGRLRKKGERQVGPMIITKEIKNPTQAHRFFENDGGMNGFMNSVKPLVGQMMSDYIMNDALKDIARLRIPFDVHIDTN